MLARERLAQLLAQNLPNVRLWKVVAKFNDLRELVSGQVISAMPPHGFLGKIRIAFDDEELDGLARAFVGNTDGGGFEHAGTERHDLLHFVGEHFESGHDDDILLAVEDLDEAISIQHSDIPCLQPAVLGEDLTRLVRTHPIALHHLRTTYPDFAAFPDRHRATFVVSNAELG